MVPPKLKMPVAPVVDIVMVPVAVLSMVLPARLKMPRPEF